MSDKNLNTEYKPDPFISQNVWLKRLGGIILLVGLGLVSASPLLKVITVLVIIFAIVTYFIKQIKGFFGSLWNS